MQAPRLRPGSLRFIPGRAVPEKLITFILQTDKILITMKKLVPFLCAALLAGALAACDKNDDNGSAPPPGDKRIVGMAIIDESGVIEENYTFGYDAGGRMSSMPPLAFSYSPDGFVAAGALTGSEDYLRFEYALSGGLARSLVCTETDGDYTYSFRQDYAYEGGRLSRIDWAEDDYDIRYSFGWTGANITGIDITDDGDLEEVRIIPGTTPNNMNLDLFGIIFMDFTEGIPDFAMLNGFAGERTAMLPAAFFDTVYNEAFAEFSYTLDKDGYITDIRMRWENHYDRLHFTYR